MRRLTKRAHATPRLLLYGHDSYGLGHLRRNMTLAAALTHTVPDLSILLLTGSPAVQHFEMPPNVDYIKLPSVVKVADEDYHARTLRMQSAEIVRLRAALLRDAAVRFSPDIVLIDHAPIGMKGELLPALEKLQLARPRPRIVLGMRDVVDEAERVQANWSRKGIYAALDRFYDAILVYGVPKVLDVISSYALTPAMAAKVRYCGYLPRARMSAAPLPVRAALASPEERLVLVTAGGGGDGFPLLRMYLEGLKTSAAPERVASVLVTGPFMPAEQRCELEALAATHERARVLEFTDDLLGLMQAADLVVCMGGYNTICEVLSTRVRALVVPRCTPRLEQAIRAHALEELRLVAMLGAEALSPQRLMERVVELLEERGYWGRVAHQEALTAFEAMGALDGLSNAAGALAELLQIPMPTTTLVS